MKIETIIFDFDGTFAPQTNRLHFESFREAFSEYGIEVGEEDLADYFGVPQEDIIRIILMQYPDIGEDAVGKINEHKNLSYREKIKGEEIPPGNIETAEELKERGFRTAISTGSHRDVMNELLPEHLMDDLTTAEDTHRPKPDPEILLRTARDLDMAPERCVYVGDSWRDCKAARAAEMGFIGVPADITRKGLMESRPDILIDSVPELLDIFEEAPEELDI